MESSKIAVSDERLKRAFNYASKISSNNSIEKIKDELTSKLSVNIGKVLKWYIGIDKITVYLINENKTVDCTLNQIFINKDAIFSFIPVGKTVLDVENQMEYILPDNTIYANILYLKSDKKEDYVVLGFTNYKEPTMNSANNGELLLQVGNNKISITRERMNIMSEYLFINGLPYDNPDTSNFTWDKEYYSKDEVDALINEIWEYILEEE